MAGVAPPVVLDGTLTRLDGGLDPGVFVAVGDSVNDVELFEVAGTSVAVANCDDAARDAASAVTDGSYGASAVEALERVRGRSSGRM